MGSRNKFCQPIEMLFMKLQVCLIKATILMWCMWMSAKYLACHYVTLWWRDENRAKWMWCTI